MSERIQLIRGGNRNEEIVILRDHWSKNLIIEDYRSQTSHSQKRIPNMERKKTRRNPVVLTQALCGLIVLAT